MADNKRKLNRREFMKASATTTAALGMSLGPIPALGALSRASAGKKVIVIGIDGMDPNLSERMMQAGQLPNLAKMRDKGGFSRLGTSIPPQSPVAWANFINGAGPGSHGIFDFIHRDPDKQCMPFYSAAETVAGQGFWEVGNYKLQLPFWPFSHKPAETLLKRQGVPFWDYLDESHIRSVFYDLPSNYPPSKSKYGRHYCLSGMGTTDLLGTYGTYQHFAEDGPYRTEDEGGGKRSCLFFENERAEGVIYGPRNDFLKKPQPTKIEFVVHRDVKARAAVIEIQGQKIILPQGQWSKWTKVNFTISMPSFLPDEHVNGICRFYLQEVAPNFRLYVTPINIDPSDPAAQITEPKDFAQDIAKELGLFYTTGFQEDHKALSNGVFTDAEYAEQAMYVLGERMNLLHYAIRHYKEGLLFFYFSSTDLQSHMFWWDSDEKHPVRSASEAKKYFDHIGKIYMKMDAVVGNILKKYGDEALVLVLSDHGFANFRRQFNLNSWLRDNGYLGPAYCSSILADADWSMTRAFGMGINGLYLNQSGREKYGIVDPGQERQELLNELVTKLQAARDENGKPIIRTVHRTDKIYQGSATQLAPDLIIGYYRGYRASWDTCLGDLSDEVMSDNDSAWSADHCADVAEVPGVLFSNRPIAMHGPALIDLAPTILAEYGLPRPGTMTGKNIFKG